MSTKSEQAKELLEKIDAAKEEGRHDGILGKNEGRTNPDAVTAGEVLGHGLAAAVTGGASLLFTVAHYAERGEDKQTKAVLDAAYDKGREEGKAMRNGENANEITVTIKK